VVDEVQLIADRDRGGSWTRAVLGLNADEIHLCGNLASRKMMTHLAKMTKERIEIRTYKRLSSLTLADVSGDITNSSTLEILTELWSHSIRSKASGAKSERETL